MNYETRITGDYKGLQGGKRALQVSEKIRKSGFSRVHPEMGRGNWRVKEYKQRRSPPSFAPGIFFTVR